MSSPGWRCGLRLRRAAPSDDRRCGDGAGRSRRRLAGEAPCLIRSRRLGSLPWPAWPLLGRGRGPSVSAVLRPAACAGVTAVLLALLVWFGVELRTGGGQTGLAERMAAGAQARGARGDPDVLRVSPTRQRQPAGQVTVHG
jgi:hypothetical protein